MAASGQLVGRPRERAPAALRLGWGCGRTDPQGDPLVELVGQGGRECEIGGPLMLGGGFLAEWRVAGERDRCPLL